MFNIDLAAKDSIFVDRRNPPKYPPWVAEILEPDLELSGPEYIHINELGVCYPMMHVQNIYDILVRYHKIVPRCLRLHDLEAIKEMGVEFFRKHFADGKICGWASVVRNKDGHKAVPFLCENESANLVIVWYFLGGRNTSAVCRYILVTFSR